MDQLFIFIGPYHIIIEIDADWPVNMNALYFCYVLKFVFEQVERDEDLRQLDYFVGIYLEDFYAYEDVMFDFNDDDPDNPIFDYPDES